MNGRDESLSHDRRRLSQLRLKQAEIGRMEEAASREATQWEDSSSQAEVSVTRGRSAMRFSLIFFSADGSSLERDKYRPVLECARFADEHDFDAVWIPERHFYQFGGLYPSPSVLAASLATITSRVHIRAGSVVLPLEHPVRVAEEWSVIDNLSNGRVGVSFASGWSPGDFVFAPEAYARRKEILFENIEVVRKLWRGEGVSFRAGGRQAVEVRILPRPLQPELPVWVSSVGSSETCQRAGAIGANLLTALLRQSVDEAARSIALYRAALQQHGYDPASRRVTLMLHTFVGESMESVRETVRAPLMTYLHTYLGLYENLITQLQLNIDINRLKEADKKTLAAYAFERYFTTSGLFGTPESCQVMVKRLQAIGVDEIACLLDFGVNAQEVSSSLLYLSRLKDLISNQKETEHA